MIDKSIDRGENSNDEVSAAANCPPLYVVCKGTKLFRIKTFFFLRFSVISTKDVSFMRFWR